MIKNFLEQLRTQRWDDHRYYHHSRINQSLHFVSAISFMIGYVMMFIDPLMSALIGWLVSMTSRQAAAATSTLRKRTSEKWPSGGMRRRSASSMRSAPASHLV